MESNRATTVVVSTPWTSYAGGGESARGRVTAQDRAGADPDAWGPVWIAAAQRAARKIFGAVWLTTPHTIDAASEMYGATAVDSRGNVRGTVLIAVQE